MVRSWQRRPQSPAVSLFWTPIGPHQLASGDNAPWPVTDHAGEMGLAKSGKVVRKAAMAARPPEPIISAGPGTATDAAGDEGKDSHQRSGCQQVR